MPKYIEKYNALWAEKSEPLTIEMKCIQKGGQWEFNGKTCGMGLSYHYEEMRKILWPYLDSHRWHELCRDEIIRAKVCVLMGPGSSGKTHEAAWSKLCEYFCFPDDTLVLVSSTDLRGLKLRVWGEIVMLWNKAREQYPWLPGHLIDSRVAISTDDIEEEGVRDMRKGIIGVPCIQNGQFVGLGKFLGIKQKRIRLIADEAQFMGSSFLSAFANLDKNPDFKAIVLGNPNDLLDPLGKAAEPRAGWTQYLSPDRTTVWDTRFFNGRCVNLVGTDSPNFDYPATEPTRFAYLISREKIANTLSFFPKDSLEYQSQCVGTMRTGMLSDRVITREACEKFGAMNDVVWKGTPITKIYGLDAAYGGDRCVGGHVEFGEDINGHTIINIRPPHIIPVRVGTNVLPEDQIAEHIKDYCIAEGIPAENVFHDSTGRGALGTSLARVWSAQTNPVEFGGLPTDRPVCLDLYIYDSETRSRRLKRCNEHYQKFVTELWFSVRYAIEASQIRNLPEDIMEELCMRKFEYFNHKYVLEPKRGTTSKPGMKERTGRSPDLGDFLSICVEGARRRGFQIAKLASEDYQQKTWDWLDDIQRKENERREGYTLNFTA